MKGNPTVIRAVLLDLGSTLVRNTPDQAREDSAYQDFIRNVGTLTDDLEARRLAQRMKERLWLRVSSFIGKATRQPSTAHIVAQVLNEIGLEFQVKRVQQNLPTLFAAEIAAMSCEPGNLRTLKRIKAMGKAVGVVTNTLVPAQLLFSRLQALGILPLADAVIASSELGWRKPHPRVFETASRCLDVDPNCTVFVGDRLDDDIAGAAAAGMLTVLSRQYRSETIDVPHVRPDHTISRLSELPMLIKDVERVGAITSK